MHFRHQKLINKIHFENLQKVLYRAENQKFLGNSKKIYTWYGVVGIAVAVAVVVVVSDSKFVRTITRVYMNRFR